MRERHWRAFFSILPENYLRVRTDWSAKLTSRLGKRPNKITPATAQANTKDKAGEVTRRGFATPGSSEGGAPPSWGYYKGAGPLVRVGEAGFRAEATREGGILETVC